MQDFGLTETCKMAKHVGFLRHSCAKDSKYKKLSISKLLNYIYRYKYRKMPAIYYFLCSFLHLNKDHQVQHLLVHSRSCLLICQQKEQAMSDRKHFFLLHPPCWVEQEEMTHKPHRKWLRKKKNLWRYSSRLREWRCTAVQNLLPAQQSAHRCVHTHPPTVLALLSISGLLFAEN